MSVVFNIPYTCRESADHVRDLIANPVLVNEARYLKKCKEWFETHWPGYTAFMTTSCTRALELIALGMNIREGDEIILSPFNYVGVGNAFANYGAQLVYVDIDPQTMNINADLIEAAITPKTKAVIAMHYASIPCDLEKIKHICDKHHLLLIEDNAQGIQASYQGQPLGSFGDFSCISFDMLKNISCNEGGVLLCKNSFANEVDVAYSNGTNKSAFSKGLVNKYEWTDRGSKFAMSEYTAAVLYPLLEKSVQIIKDRKKIWKELFEKISKEEILTPYVPQVLMNVEHNGHLAYLKFKDTAQRDKVMKFMNSAGVSCSFHYVPLDDSLAGKRYAPSGMACAHSLRESSCLLRLPIHNYLTEDDQQEIVRTLLAAMEHAPATMSL